MDEQQTQKPPEAPSPAPAPAPAPAAPKSDAEANKWYGVIAYLSILCLIPLFAAKKSPFAQFHARQGLVLFLAGIVLNVVSYFVPGYGVGFIVWWVELALGIIALIGLINAWQGKMWEIPVVADVAKQIKM